ncbi:hypothetical protein Q5424_13285 [Conexibacter sp. JD483]|uniref:hypothetical protein n=1 Tax=unclassified Conexibacter TaxID=2627773 RepID=UPI00271B17BB|nr:MULTISPECIES: hypothetical protein [unclassified Conexibacter]MDO8184580.1 hypothetical protein [Conexibacter sp. CPCC 205706]MDO8197886.1 hypothetical protein [Conexibacter sp. CPCC 205762]MDR9370068.1 hypothetical protein [Conexibacter sp. JD483]
MRRTAALITAVTASAALTATAVAPLAASAAASRAAIRRFALARGLRRQIAAIERHTTVPVLLPDEVLIDVPNGHGIEQKWSANRPGWQISLGIGPRCGGANACFVGQFTGTRGGRLAFRSRVRLHGGVIGRYKPSTCGASCSPPEIQWKLRDVLYDVQFRAAGSGTDKQKLVAIANSALAAGPR